MRELPRTGLSEPRRMYTPLPYSAESLLDCTCLWVQSEQGARGLGALGPWGSLGSRLIKWNVTVWVQSMNCAGHQNLKPFLGRGFMDVAYRSESTGETFRTVAQNPKQTESQGSWPRMAAA